MKLFPIALAACLAASPVFAGPLSDLIPQMSIGPYGGLRTGYSTSRDPVVGANVGYGLGFVRAELDYDRLGFRNVSSNVVTANGILEVPIWKLHPYVLGGIGYTWRNSPGYFADHANWAAGSALWNVGGGVRYALTSYLDLDARYRVMQPFRTQLSLTQPYAKNGDLYSVFTMGVNVNF